MDDCRLAQMDAMLEIVDELNGARCLMDSRLARSWRGARSGQKARQALARQCHPMDASRPLTPSGGRHGQR